MRFIPRDSTCYLCSNVKFQICKWTLNNEFNEIFNVFFLLSVFISSWQRVLWQRVLRSDWVVLRPMEAKERYWYTRFSMTRSNGRRWRSAESRHLSSRALYDIMFSLFCCVSSLTLSLLWTYHCRQWKSWCIFASPVAKGLIKWVWKLCELWSLLNALVLWIDLIIIIIMVGSW